MPLPALAAVAKAAAPMLKKAALKAAKKKAVSTAMKAVRPKEEEQESMKKEYNKGGRKPGAAQDKVAKALSNRSSNQKFKSEINKLRSDRMSDKASTTKNKVVKKLREEVATKRADQARGNEAKAERSAKASSFASKRGDMARNRSKNKSAKAEIRAKYENGGRKTGDPKEKSKVKAHLKDLEKGNYVKKSWDSSPSWNQNRAPEKMMKYNRVGSPGSKKTNEELKRATKGSVGDMELRYKTGKSAAQLFDATDKSHRVPNKALAKKTEDFGSMGKKTYYSGNPGGLKGKTKGKGGNVGKGVQVKKKRLR
jgi:hypothetical protein